MHICKVLSSVQVDPKSFRCITSLHVHGTKKVHRASAHAAQCGNRGALVDRGANGGIIGNDAHALYTHPGQEVDVAGIDNHQIDSLKVVDASAKIFTQRGEAIGMFRQHTYHGKGRTIHSSGQIEWCTGNIVHDRSLKVGGAQHVHALDGYVLPIDVDNGLPHISQVPHTQKEFDELPNVMFSSSAEWDPTVLDNKLSSQPNWFNIVKNDTEDGHLCTSPFDAHGNYTYRYPNDKPRSRNSKIQHMEIRSLPSLQTDQDHDDDSSIESSDTVDEHLTEPNGRKLSFRECYHLACDMNPTCVCMEHDLCESEPQDKPENPTSKPTKSTETNKTPVQVKKKPIDYSQCRAHFLGVPIEKIKATFQATTQFATNIMAGNKILQTIKSPWPANNVRQHNEPVATDTIKAQVPAVDDGSTMAQLFIGQKSLVSDAYGVKTDAAFVNTLEDNIRQHGAMDKLISDGAQAELSDRAKDVLRALCIDDWHSEAHYQHQNFAEHRWRHIKKNVEWLMNLQNCPPEVWLLALQYVCGIMNHTTEKSLGNRPPL